jgi:hypothetical protein
MTAGYRLAATPGTRDALARAGFTADLVTKLGEPADPDAGVPGILDLIRSGAVRLVVNTPTPRSGAVRDAAEIRHVAIEEGILCLTALETGIAAAEALDPEIAERLAEVRSLADWVPSAGRAPSGTGSLADQAVAARPGQDVGMRPGQDVGMRPGQDVGMNRA